MGLFSPFERKAPPLVSVFAPGPNMEATLQGLQLRAPLTAPLVPTATQPSAGLLPTVGKSPSTPSSVLGAPTFPSDKPSTSTTGRGVLGRNPIAPRF